MSAHTQSASVTFPACWPSPPRIVRNHTLDSTRWNAVRLGKGDVVVATWAKSGTTWMQQIVTQILTAGSRDAPLVDPACWIEQRWYPQRKMLAFLENVTPRVLKTHLPADALVYSPDAQYIFVGRDGRDVVVSLHNHHLNLTPLVYAILNRTPGREGPPLDPPPADLRVYFREWLERDGHPFWPYWSHVRSWWNARHLPNVLLVHFNDLKNHLRDEVLRTARFLGVDISGPALAQILERSTFDYAKRRAAEPSAELAQALHGGAQTFVHKGSNGRWRDLLTPEDSAAYLQQASANLEPACAHWLAHGRHEPASNAPETSA